MELFNRYKNKIISVFGKKPLDTQQINSLGQKLLGKCYQGSFAQNEKFEIKNGYYIINTDLVGRIGEHWIAMIISGKRAYIYDSYGRSTKKILKHLYKRLIDMGFKIIEADKDPEQKNSGNQKYICGHLSIAFLKVAKLKGIRVALSI